MAAIAAVLLVDAAALSALVARHGWLLIAVGVAVGRLGITLCCARRIPAARPDGLGALVAGTVPAPVCAAWALALIALGAVAGRLTEGAGRLAGNGLGPGGAGGAAGLRRWCCCWPGSACAGSAASPATCSAPAASWRQRWRCWH